MLLRKAREAKQIENHSVLHRDHELDLNVAIQNAKSGEIEWAHNVKSPARALTLEGLIGAKEWMPFAPPS